MPRRRGETGTPTSNQPPRGTRDAGYWGPRRFALAPSLLCLAKSGRALGPGATIGILGTGVPRLACLRPAAWLNEWPSTAHLHPHMLKTLAGQMTGGFLRHGLIRLAREEAERSRQGTSRGAHDASHDDPSQAGARRAPAYAVSLFPLWCKGGKHRQGHQAKVNISGQRGQDQQSGRMEVTVEPKTASSPVPLAAEDQL